MERADVVVVGAGLAGLQCARLVAQRGWRVVLVDRKRSPDQFVHTTGIFVRRTFDDFRFPEGTLGPPVRRVTVCAPSGRSVTFESGRDEFRIGRMGQLYRAMLADVPDFRGGLSFDSLSFGAEDSVVTLRGPAGTTRIRTRLVVGADGASSRVAAGLRLPAPSSFLVGVEEVFKPAASGREPQLRCFLDPRLAPGYIAWIADDGEEVHAGAAGIERRFDATSALRRLRVLVRDHCGVTGDPVERRGGRIPVGGISRTISTTRGLLVGDAAGAVSPLTAGGLDAAIRLSTFAAMTLDRSLASGTRLPDLYSGERFRTRFVSRVWMRHLFSFLRPSHVEAAVFLLDRTALRRLGEKIFFGHGSFPIDREELGAVAEVTST